MLLAPTILGFFVCVAAVCQSFSDIQTSSLIPLADGVQCFAYVLLQLKIDDQRSIAGISISGEMLLLQGAAYVLRVVLGLGSGHGPLLDNQDTLVINMFAFALVVQLCRTMFTKTQQSKTCWNAASMVCLCIFMAVLIRPDIHDSILLDMIWAVGLYLDSFALVPQFILMKNRAAGGDAAVGQFAAVTAGSKFVSLCFWLLRFGDLAPPDGGLNLAGYAIVLAQSVQVLSACILASKTWIADTEGSANKVDSKPVQRVPRRPVFETSEVIEERRVEKTIRSDSNCQSSELVRYNAAIDRAAKAGDLVTAEDYMARMQQAGIKPSVVSFGTVINACAKAGKTTRARYWLTQMIAAGLEPNVITYNALINGAAKLGELENAEEFLAQMNEGEADLITYNAVLNACAKRGNTSRAEYWFKRLARHSSSLTSSPTRRSFTLTLAARMLPKQKNGFSVCAMMM
jgi:pentatricopeptide repeat domain-containing protein 1